MQLHKIIYRVVSSDNNVHEDIDEPEVDTPLVSQSFTEHDLYPMLIKYLSKDLNLFCLRIDERKSKNSHGSGDNHWLHPDIVALEPLDQGWDEIVRTCVRSGNHSSVRLWSFEVKKAPDKREYPKIFLPSSFKFELGKFRLFSGNWFGCRCGS